MSFINSAILAALALQTTSPMPFAADPALTQARQCGADALHKRFPGQPMATKTNPQTGSTEISVKTSGFFNGSVIARDNYVIVERNTRGELLVESIALAKFAGVEGEKVPAVYGIEASRIFTWASSRVIDTDFHVTDRPTPSYYAGYSQNGVDFNKHADIAYRHIKGARALIAAQAQDIARDVQRCLRRPIRA